MKRLVVLSILLMSLSLLSLDSRAEDNFSVQWPPDSSYVENEMIAIILKMEKQAIDTVRVGIGTKKSLEIPVAVDVERACLVITLAEGLNTIELFGLKKGTVIGQETVKIYLRSDLQPKFQKAPAGFERYVFHYTENEENCVGCHEMAPTLSSLRPVTPEQSPCYSCHAQKNVNRFVHNPADQWTCFTCHEVLQGKRKYTTPKPDQKVCYPCHNSEIKTWKTKKIMHGPTAVGECTLCHNPHSSKQPAFLRMQTTELCVKCHEDKASGAHVLAGFLGKEHPVRGVKDPFKPGREFSCAGCHNPHAGDTRNLLNHDISNMSDYCTTCHKM